MAKRDLPADLLRAGLADREKWIASLRGECAKVEAEDVARRERIAVLEAEATDIREAMGRLSAR